MKTVSTRGGLDATALKLIGVVTMTMDHIGYILFPNLAVLRIIGRLAYPIFAYLIAEGCTYSRHKAKYFLSVLGTGLLCSVASYWAERSLYQSIMITFACSIGLIFLLERARTQRKRALWIGVFALALTACFLLFQLRLLPGFTTDYGFLGIITPLLVWLGKRKREENLGTDRGIMPDRLRNGWDTDFLLGGCSPVGAVQWGTGEISVEDLLLPLLSHPLGCNIWDCPVDVKKLLGMVPGSFCVEKKSRRESGVPSVLQGKTLAQAEFTSAEQVRSKRVPKKESFLGPPGVRRPKRFAEQNLGAGRIHFCRASEINQNH